MEHGTEQANWMASYAMTGQDLGDISEPRIRTEVQRFRSAIISGVLFISNSPTSNIDYLGLIGIPGWYADGMVGMGARDGGCICVCVVAGQTRHMFPSPKRLLQLKIKKVALQLQYEMACATHGPHSFQTTSICELLAEANRELGPNVGP